jgi:hypothetical protein
MARLNEDAQWIILMGFLVSFSFFFLALVINQSTVVGQTTAESVIEFPKSDIRDTREVIIETSGIPNAVNRTTVQTDIREISKKRLDAIVNSSFTLPNPPTDSKTYAYIHFNNGVTEYNEVWVSL